MNRYVVPVVKRSRNLKPLHVENNNAMLGPVRASDGISSSIPVLSGVDFNGRSFRSRAKTFSLCLAKGNCALFKNVGIGEGRAEGANLIVGVAEQTDIAPPFGPCSQLLAPLAGIFVGSEPVEPEAADHAAGHAGQCVEVFVPAQAGG